MENITHKTLFGADGITHQFHISFQQLDITLSHFHLTSNKLELLDNTEGYVISSSICRYTYIHNEIPQNVCTQKGRFILASMVHHAGTSSMQALR